MSNLRTLAINILFITLAAVANNASAEPNSAPRSFAVFQTYYNPGEARVRYGVCGTVFFVSQDHAITANHVLNEHSFTPPAGFHRVRMWLVHEGERPIEVQASYLKTNPDNDVTVVTLPDSEKVDARFVFKTAEIEPGPNPVESDGFVANSSGPTLVQQGQEWVITQVPNLLRVHLTGQLIRQAHVTTLPGGNVLLKHAPEIEVSYRPIIGISGGPITVHGRVVAMNSVAGPGFQHTWGLQLRAPGNGLTLP